LARLLGVGEATLSRWETGGQIQQRALDRLLRLYFAVPPARDALDGLDAHPELGATVATADRGRGKARMRRQAGEALTRSPETARLIAELEDLPAHHRGAMIEQFENLLRLLRPSGKRTRAG
jgi:transcriptional regulator with XRE-family HTH domain